MVAPHRYEFVIDDVVAGRRLDVFLAEQQLPFTRSQIKKYVDAEYAQINGAPAKPAYKLKCSDTLVFAPPPPEPCEVEAEAIAIRVFYQDDAVIVVDKPAGMVVHPAAGHKRGTLVAALLSHCDQLSGVGGVLRPGIVHRLDKLTSGVMVASKTDAAHHALAEQFRTHSIERRYHAIIYGQMPRGSGTFDTPYGRHPIHRKRFTTKPRIPADESQSTVRRAITHYRVLEQLRGASLVEAELKTGRTHQVRVHFTEAGHGLLGDPGYGRCPNDPLLRQCAKQLGRQALHAVTLAFDHPITAQRLRFDSPLPDDMVAVLQQLRV